MKITKTLWFTDARISFGIVMGEDDEGNPKAYIGPASGGFEEESDAMDIAALGAKILPEQAKELNEFLNPTKKEA